MLLPVSCPSPVFHLFSSGGVAWSLRPLAWLGVAHPPAGGPALGSWLCVLWGRHKTPGRGRLLPGCGASGAGRSAKPYRLSLGRAAGARYPLAVGAEGVGVGAGHQPHSARSCELALRALGAARGRPGGGGLLPGCGASGVGHSSTPDSLSFWRAAGARCPLAVGAPVLARGPFTYCTARALASWLCTLWGRQEGARVGRHFLPGCGASGVGRSPTPRCPSLGHADRVCYLLAVGAVVVGVGTHDQPPSARAWELALRAVGAPLAWVWGVQCWVLSHT